MYANQVFLLIINTFSSHFLQAIFATTKLLLENLLTKTMTFEISRLSSGLARKCDLDVVLLVYCDPGKNYNGQRART